MNHPRGDASPVRVLAVEDSPTQAAALQYYLEVQGFAPIMATNGREALDLMKKDVPDIVISDVMMPGMDGYELCAAIRGESTLAHIPVILVTSMSGPRDVFKGLSSGADNFVTKPYDPKYLSSRIHYLLSNRQIRQDGRFRVGVEIELAGERHFITAERQQILDLLISTYDEAVRLYDESERRRTELARANDTNKALYELSEALNGCHACGDVISRGLDQSAKLPGIRGGWVLRKDDIGQIALAASTGDIDDELVDYGNARLQDGLQNDSLHAPMVIDGKGDTEHFVCIPIIVNRHVVAAVNLVPSDEIDLHGDDLNDFASIGHQIAVSFERAQLLENLTCEVQRQTADIKRSQHELAVRARHQETVARLGQYALEGATLNKLRKAAVKEAADMLGADLAQCLELQEDGADMLLRAGVGWTQDEVGVATVPVARSTAEVAMRENRTVVVADWDAQRDFQPAPLYVQHKLRSTCTVPILGAQRAYGTLGVGWRTLRPVSTEEINFLQSVAHILSTTVQRREHNERIRAADEMVGAILDVSPIAIVAVDEKELVISWNKAATRIFGYEAEEVIGRPYPLIAADQRESFGREFERMKAGEQIRAREVKRQHKNGAALPVYGAEVALRNARGDLRACVFVMDDISERKKVEEQLRQAQKMEAVGNLTGGIAHDFNNLLAVVIGNLDMLATVIKPGEKSLEFVNEAVEAAAQGAELTRQLLSFARRQTLEPQTVNVNDLLQQMDRILSRSLGDHVESRLVMGQNLWEVRVDPTHLKSAIVNLAVNARDAMPKGGRLTIETKNAVLEEEYARAQADVTPGDYVLIEVSDSGTGMSAETLERIFEPFFTTKEAFKGTGLGLAMVHGFIKQSNGHISVYSELGHGTTFRLYIPRNLQPGAAAGAAGETAALKGGGELILVVDDNPKVRKMAVAQLESLGYRILEASNGKEALDVASGAASLDLLFTDISMPGGMNGIELARELLDKRPRIKALLTSGFPQAARENKEDLAISILGKPFRKEELARRVREVLDQP